MDKLKFGKKLCVTLLLLALVLSISAGAVLVANNSRGILNASVTTVGAATNNSGATVDAVAEYTYGQTYTMGGHDYTLGEAGMDYKTALGLGNGSNVTRSDDGYNVTLKSFTYFDGRDGTAETDSVRNAGTYVFTVEHNSESGVALQDYTVKVNRAGLDFSTVDKIPVFVNATSVGYQAHGDIMSVYKHNDGWYPSQKANEVPVEIRTITNAYYYHTGSEISIKIANELLDGIKPGTTGYDPKAKTSTLEYEGVILNIKDRAGVAYTESNEYAATFTFYLTNEQQNNYYFDYGTATEDDEIADSNKCLSITNRTEDSFILSKHWFIVKYANLFVSFKDWDENTNNPYVPFHTKTPYQNAPTTGEGTNGETYTAVDTITYTFEDLQVTTPYAKFTNKKDASGNSIKTKGAIKFDVIYDALDGQKYRIATQETLDDTKTEGPNTLTYYFNSTMPAGHYTLKLYGEIDGDKIQGEYWLTVLPKGIDLTLVNDLQSTIIGNLDESADANASGIDKYFNSYALGANKLHGDIDTEIGALNNSLNNTLSGMSGKSYWSDLSASNKATYFDSAVTVMYNRNTWSSSNYVTLEDMTGMLSTYGSYTIYYSISAKNYVTVGGANDANRTNYGFRTVLYTGIKVSDIYDSLTNSNNPYFNAVTYSGSDAKTSVPQNAYYVESFDDDEYVNVGRHSVTLTLRDDLTSWDTTLPAGVNFNDYFVLGGVNYRSLKVYYDVVPADNSWNVMPQMSSWSFNGFDKRDNAITAGLRFSSTVKYALIPNSVINPDSIEWGIVVDGELTSGKNNDNGVVYFTVDENGMVDDTTATLLNSLKPANYYLKFFVSEVTVTVTDGETSNKITNVNAYNDIARNSAGNPLANVTVSKATNSWTETPNVMTWIWGSYGSDRNTISAAATYPALKPMCGNIVDESFVYTNGGAALPVITFSIRKAGDTTPIEGLESFTAVDETIAAILETLHAGKYELTTSVGGSDYYTEITETKLTFAIAQAGNSWTTTPQVVQWTWGNYSADRNVISAATKFTGGDGSENSADKPILFTVLQVVDGNRVAVANLKNFQVGSNGKIIDSVSAAAFAALHAGSYYLRAEKQGNNDYTDITGSDNTDILFSVAQATTTWTTTPSMTSWQYGGFANNNFRTGEPKYVNTANPVTYVISKADGEEFTFGTQTASSFTFEFDDGVLADSMYTALRTLHIGDYKIAVRQEKTTDFSELTYTIEFSVLKTTNTWATAPGVIGWMYGMYNDSYFTAGVPTFNESKDKEGNPVQVVYTLTKKTADGVSDDSGFTPIEVTNPNKTFFEQLNAGTYSFSVYYAASDNYSELTATASFTIGKCTNTWEITPGLRDWDYKSFTPSLFTAGKPRLATSLDAQNNPAVVTYLVTGGNLTASVALTVNTNANGTLSLSDDSAQFLAALSAGSYLLKVNYAGSDNYDPLPLDINFHISTISNGWETRPRVIGWTFGSFDLSYFIAGVPTLNESIENGNPAQVKYTLVNSKGEYVALDNDGKVTTSTTELTLTEAQVKSLLSKLGADDYTLSASYAGTDNYGPLKAENTQIAFEVAPFTSNNWKDGISPEISGWTYGKFTASLFTTGEPERGAVTYTVYNVLEDEVAKIGNTLLEGLSYETLKGLFNSLNVGTYSLQATSGSTADYTAVTWSKRFAVANAANSWTTYPNITGWTYGSTPSTRTDGAVLYQPSSEITYTYYPASLVSSGLVANTSSDPVTISSTTPAGDYAMVVVVPASGNYDGLTYTVFFTVSKLTTAWDTTTTSDNGETFNWIYNANDNQTLNAPVLANWADGVITYTVTNDSGAQIYSGSVWTDEEKICVIATLQMQQAGSYVITASVTGDNNHTSLSYSITLVVSVAPNAWETKGANLTVEYGTTITLEYAPKFNVDRMTIKVNNVTVPDNDLNKYFENRGVGTYTITATVEADLAYGALEDTITVTITRKANGWRDNAQLEIIQKDSEGNDKTGWLWGDFVQDLENDVGVKAPVPKNGNKVVITVARNGSEQFTATLNYDEASNKKVVNSNDLAALIARLRALNVGTYSISAEIPETADYSAFTQETFEFTVEKATNLWIKAPYIIGWNYNSTTAYPDATPKYGNKNDVQYSYAVKGEYAKAEDVPENEWQATQPILGGVYYLRGILAGTDNYDQIVGYSTFSIGTGENAWVNMPGVIAWNWNNYNKEVNQFSGSARSGGVVKFTINKPGESDYVALGSSDLSDTSLDYKKLQGFTFVIGSDKKVTKYISDDVAKVLNALKPGTYNLYAVVAADENYQSISGNIAFEVGKANNEWTTAPNALSYDYNGYVASGDRASFTAGKSKYGTINYAVVKGNKFVELGGNGQAVMLDNMTAPLTANDVRALLPKLDAGSYILNAWVVAGDTYEAFYSSGSPYQVLFGVSRIENNWKQDNKPATSVSETYVNLHKNGFTIESLFVAPQTIYDDAIVYTLLNYDQSVAKVNGENATEYSYDKLLAAIKGLDPGDYIIRMTVDGSDNYLALIGNTSLTITRLANSFDKFPAGNLEGEWRQGSDGKNATALTDFDEAISAEYGAITYTINGLTIDGKGIKNVSYGELKAAVATLNADSYQVTVSVEQTNEYEGLERTIQLDIKQGANDFTVTADNEWTWHDGESHIVIKDLTYGSQVYVAITKENADSALSYITIDFSIENPLSVLNQIINGTRGEDGQIVGGLDAGNYSLTVTARASTNWEEVSKTVAFAIAKTSNAWTEGGEPALDGELKDGVYKYEFGDTVTPSALSQHGTAKYTYYVNNDDYAQGKAKPLGGKPANVGEYVVEISVDATTNHDGINATVLYFDIDKVLNDGFIVSPAAVGWTWGSYDRAVHMFTGIPRSGGNVSFSILDESKSVVIIDGIALDKMLLVGLTENGEQHYNDVDKDMCLEKDYILLVSKLIEGNYFLQINVEATTNNTEFSATAPFRVDAAKNGWKVTPKIASWSLELWSEDANMPKAESMFGTPHIVVNSKNNNEVFYDNMHFNADKGEYEVLNRLKNALAGWYTMTVTVDGLDGCYDGLFETVDVQVYMRGSNETKNYWYETYGINAWEARVDSIGNEPYGKPLRGLPYFEFYYAKGEGSSAEIDWDRPVTEGEDSYLVKKGDNVYYKDFYMPMAPGYYFMVACAVNVDSDGNVIEADSLREIKTPYPLHIGYRANTFTDDPRIDTLLFLGDRANWAKPTVTASLSDSEFWFTYQNIETGEDLGRSMPTVEGRYRVTAHILAKYSEEKTKYADFTVELSTNEWVTEPTIEDWSEEFLEKNPEALSKYGDEIIYTYENLETGEKFDTKPTTEGTYKMTATVKHAGYKDLVGTTTFTIDPAYDKDLIVADIVLGLVACALAVFVIIFAIRRYKEN